MGAAVARRLAVRSGADVAVLTRDPAGDKAKAVQAVGDIELVRGDLDDQAALDAAMEGVDAVFCNTDFFSTASPSNEHEQGLRALEAAERAVVGQFVWSSLDSAVTLTDGRIPVPHYDAKAAVEAHIGLRRSEEMMRQDPDGWYSRNVAVLVTAPYYENFQGGMAPTTGELPDGRNGVTFYIPMGTGAYPLIAVDDIAWFAAHVLDNWDRWRGRTLRIVGDSLTGEQIARTFEHATGVPGAYEDVPLDALRGMIPRVGHDFAAMFEFFQDYDVAGRARDITALRAIHPELMSFDGWLRSTGWTAGATPGPDLPRPPGRLGTGSPPADAPAARPQYLRRAHAAAQHPSGQDPVR